MQSTLACFTLENYVFLKGHVLQHGPGSRQLPFHISAYASLTPSLAMMQSRICVAQRLSPSSSIATELVAFSFTTSSPFSKSFCLRWPTMECMPIRPRQKNAIMAWVHCSVLNEIKGILTALLGEQGNCNGYPINLLPYNISQ